MGQKDKIQYHKGQGLNWLQAFLRHKNATTTEKYLKNLGLKPLREGLDEGFKRPGEVVEFKKKPPKGSVSEAKGVRQGVRT